MKIFLTVKPGSYKDEIIALDPTHYQVSVTAPASQNKANEAIIELLSDYFHVAKSLITISRGKNTKKKTIIIATNLNLPI